MKQFSFFAIYFVSLTCFAQTLPPKSDIINVMKKVNDYWITQNPVPGNNQWARAAYFTGNMDFYKIYPKEKYLNYALLWANNNNWSLNGGTSTRNADNQTCGQIYIDLFKMDPNSSNNRISAIKTSIDNMVFSSKKDDWWWIDALYMAMPVFARLGNLYQDDSYYQKMYDLYQDAKVNRGLYNIADQIWFRDGNFMQTNDTTTAGKKIYWSRGNGWVVGAHVRTLQLLPLNHPNRAEYITTFQEMASALKNRQQTDGFWYANLDDPNHYGGPETSGTAFFTYGLAWGVNEGFLDKASYYPVIEKAWKALTSVSVQANGFLAYVQGVGSEPRSSQPVTINSTADFGVGAFLLAGSEVVKLAEGVMPVPSNFNLQSVKTTAKNRIEVKFSSSAETNSAMNIINYKIDNDIVISKIEAGLNDSTFFLTTSELIPGKYILNVENIRDKQQQQIVETGEKMAFSYTGIAAVSASGSEPNTANTPDKSIDYDLGSRWSCEGKGQWILYDLGDTKQVYSVELAYFNGAARKAYMKIQLSTNLTDTTDVFNGETSGTTTALETYAFTPVDARYIKVIGYGNSVSNWNSITEARINYVEKGTNTTGYDKAINQIKILQQENSNFLTIQIIPNIEGCNLSMTDITGRLIHSVYIAPGLTSISFDNWSVQQGIYLLKTEHSSTKFIIK